MWKWLISRKKLKDYYAVLGVSPGASAKAIQHAFWKAARTQHPDVNPDPDVLEQFQEVVEAYQTLKGSDARDDYDAQVITQYCQSFLGSFEADERPRKKPTPAIVRAWRGENQARSTGAGRYRPCLRRSRRRPGGSRRHGSR